VWLAETPSTGRPVDMSAMNRRPCSARFHRSDPLRPPPEARPREACLMPDTFITIGELLHEGQLSDVLQSSASVDTASPTLVTGAESRTCPRAYPSRWAWSRDVSQWVAQRPQGRGTISHTGESSAWVQSRFGGRLSLAKTPSVAK